MKADLHIYSTVSDGVDTIEQIIIIAQNGKTFYTATMSSRKGWFDATNIL